jgi:hypothetical protein
MTLSMMTFSILTFKKHSIGIVLYRHHDTWQNDTWHNDIEQKKIFVLFCFGTKTHGMKTLSIPTFKKCVFGLVLYRGHDTQQNDSWYNDI